MSIVIMVGQLVLGLSILIILHELGHFLTARAFGIKVDKFYLFFDAWNISLFKFTYKGVEYGIGWLPLGGYVKIAGMIDESMDTDQMAGPPQPWEFRSKPAWQRLIVMLGGVTVNIILGIVIFWILTIRFGESYIPNASAKFGIVPGVVGKKIGLLPGDKITAVNGKEIVRFDDLTSPKVLLENTVFTVVRGAQTLSITVPHTILNDLADHGIEEFISRVPRTKFSVDSVYGNAKKAGLQKGDSVVAVNGQPVVFFDEMQSQLAANKGKVVDLSVKRNNAILPLKAQVTADGTIGFARPKSDFPEVKTIKYGFFQSFPIGAARAISTFTDNAKGLGKIFKGDVKFNKAVSGPVAIANLFGGTIDWVHFWSLVGFLSMVLALMNLLPIPALDGGHAVFLIVEMIKGKPLSDKFLERAQIVGFVILVTLMVFVFGNDIVNKVMKK
ncbi:RIP metalloprotease RseP [Mucilaginibacter ginsenosidivorax]|uniref:Zinc metalloprotease n=1 Tax=Mucilaginibacter ginsenosidivorax TaxID=862126 RepID=A0A5B8VT38_9SPHI|nr:RIP metalloprotease RseP [Mucilaginibacter ginsenosidivorax]QEC74443.1 RIP metalloprotease RseP [Mucilaginibacter ginsenosidivorax]